MKRPSPGLIAAWLAVIVALLLDARVALRGDLPSISPEEMALARTQLRALRKPGDVLVHSPLFRVAALAGLEQERISPDVPNARTRATRRILVLEPRHAPRLDLGEKQSEEVVGERLVISVYAPPDGVRYRFDLYDDLDQVRLSVARGDRVTDCRTPRPEGGFACPPEPEWIYLAQRELVIEGENTRCVWAHPSTGATLHFGLPAPNAAGRIEVRGALADDAAQNTPDGAPVRTEIWQAGRALAEFVAPNRVGWSTASATVAAGAPLELRVSTPRDGRRHFCLNAIVRGDPS